MKRLLFSLVIVFALSTCASAQIEYIGFSLPEDASSGTPYQLEPYFFLHYFYVDVLYFFDLLDKVDLQTKMEMFAKILNNIREDYPVELVIKFDDWDEPLRVSYRVFASEGRQIVFMTTNFDLENQETLPAYTWECYAHIYYIFGDKLVNNYYLFSEEKEEVHMTDLNDLADFYIFDERVDNDHLIEDLLLAHINAGDEPLVSRFVGYLTLTQYYMVINELEKAGKRLAEAEGLFEELREKDKENWGALLTMTKEQVEVIAQIRGALPQDEE